MSAGLRILLVGDAADTRTALARHCLPADIGVFAGADAALTCLHEGVGSGVPQKLKLAVIDNAGDAAAAVAAFKADALAALLPVVVIAAAAVHEACYRAGANACMVKPQSAGALAEAAAALAGFWLSANELPSTVD
jgi:hypothetical protein